MDIIFLRHGETEDNVSKVYSRDSVGLSKRGELQVRNTKERIEKMDFQRVYFSPLRRTKATLELLGLKGNSEPRIREMDFGIFKGKTYGQIVSEYPLETKEWFKNINSYCIPQGESLEMVYERLTQFLQELVVEGKNALLITHEGIIRLACCWVFDDINHFYRFKADNGSLSIISIHEDYKYITQLNSKF